MECIVCYTDAKVSNERCRLCKVSLCETCWLDRCRMLCPICDRTALNAKRRCFACDASFHVKDIDSCCMCGTQVCRECFSDSKNVVCDALISDVVVDPIPPSHLERQVLLAFSHIERGCSVPFRVIARVSTVWVFKADANMVTIMVDDVEDDTLLEGLRLKLVEIDNLRIACNSFDVRRDWKHLQDIFHRLPQLRQ